MGDVLEIKVLEEAGSSPQSGVPRIGTRLWEQPVLADIIERMSGEHPILGRATPEQLYELICFTVNGLHAAVYGKNTFKLPPTDQKRHQVWLQSCLHDIHRGLNERLAKLKTPEEKGKETQLPYRVFFFLRDEFGKVPHLVNYIVTYGTGHKRVVGNGDQPPPTFESYAARRKELARNSRLIGLQEILEELGLATAPDILGVGAGKRPANRRYVQLNAAECSYK
ncbi:hypothetical protein HYU16_04645 [Candidatus Woesearchaeota archaeon]|nr:hypothetical protein [Candidatus Woesearchaeota archaeon]